MATTVVDVQEKMGHMDLGSIFRRYREDRQIHQTDLAQLLGVHSTYVNAIELGKFKPARFSTIQKYLRKLGLSFDGTVEEVRSSLADFRFALRDFRRQQQLTQEDLGILLDVPKGTLYSWERGLRKPTTAKMLSVMKELESLGGVTVQTVTTALPSNITLSSVTGTYRVSVTPFVSGFFSSLEIAKEFSATYS
jgi:transcriptional regulator with XRE-family HTH domain